MQSTFPVNGIILAVALSFVPQAGTQTITASPNKALAFDVISVRAENGEPRQRMSQYTSDGFRMVNMPIHNLLIQAFNVNSDEIIGEPDWVKSDRWDPMRVFSLRWLETRVGDFALTKNESW